jgi:hypothetical protein
MIKGKMFLMPENENYKPMQIEKERTGRSSAALRARLLVSR